LWREACALPVTVKHRIGIDRVDRYDFVSEFVGTLQQAGCSGFIVHARSAWLDGLSPKENRDIPPLRYDIAERLKAEFPGARFVLNGGIGSLAQAETLLKTFDGVMLGRAAYRDPYLLAGVDRIFFGDGHPAPSREDVIDRMGHKLHVLASAGDDPWYTVRHMLGLYSGQRGARHWRRLLSDPAFRRTHGPEVLTMALATMQSLDGGHEAVAA
jgi:tRNA-dihydrouridine synthase A